MINDEGKQIALTRNGEIQILDPKGRELEKYTVPNGADAARRGRPGGQPRPGALQVGPAQHPDPRRSRRQGPLRGHHRGRDAPQGEGPAPATSAGSSWSTRATCTRRSSSRTTEGKILDVYYIPEQAYLEVDEGQKVSAGTLLAKTPREVAGTQDITGGLPRVTEIFEARRPQDPAVMAEIDGRVELLDEKQRGKRTIIVRRRKRHRGREHLVPHGKHLRVHAGDYVKAGDPLVDGPLVPHDILRISGDEAVQHYLVREVQRVYRSQRVDIDDKHIEIIVAQMLRKVKVETSATPACCPARSSTSSSSAQVNDRAERVRQDQGPRRHRVRGGKIVTKDAYEEETPGIESAGGKKPPSGQAQAGHVPARSSWASPRRRCSRTASSRPPASRRRPRC